MIGINDIRLISRENQTVNHEEDEQATIVLLIKIAESIEK
jgi:hypothetical protein